MVPMTATFPELIIRLALDDPSLHSMAEVAIVICFVAVLLVREMVRYRRGPLSQSAAASLIALAMPLAIVWAFIAVERFLELAGI